jgi:FMN reductase
MLIVGTPVHRASYTGLLKYFFDLVDRNVMRHRKTMLRPTGANLMHALVLGTPVTAVDGLSAMHPTTRRFTRQATILRTARCPVHL